jgi:hypothetical protein
MNAGQHLHWSSAAIRERAESRWWWLVPLERLLGRLGDAGVALFAAGGIVLAGTSFVLLFVSERTPLFGFMEPGYDPTAIAASRIAELAAVLLLGVFLVARFIARISMPRW